MIKKVSGAFLFIALLMPSVSTANSVVYSSMPTVTNSGYVHYIDLAPEEEVYELVLEPRQTDIDFRGVWVTTVINLDFPREAGLSNEEIKAEIRYIVDRSADIGLNAIILQVRPEGDAIYPSEIFPWSRYITGVQGQAPVDGFDPLAYFIERTHERGMELHAWINPYRVTHGTSSIVDVNLLAENNPARLNPSLVVQHGNALYLDPGFPQARQLILDGITELILNYDIDGIHFDDYFYPRRTFDDSRSFALYGEGRDLFEWRVDNVNQLVYEVHTLIQYLNPDIRFGISPTGIWANSVDHPNGSETRGFQHYIELSADSVYWVERGWVDYIIPQLYWHIGFEIADYEILLPWWEDVVRDTDVALHIGHAAWREHERHEHWGAGQILRQLELNKESDVVSGSVFFRFNHIRGYVGDDIQYFYANNPIE